MSPEREGALSVSGVTQSLGSLFTSLPVVTWPAAAILAVVPTILYLRSHRRQWRRRPGWRGALWSAAVSFGAIERGGPPAIRARLLRLWKPRASDEPFKNSERNPPASATEHPDATILALFAAGRLRSSEMERLGEHVAECSVCLEILEQVPEDSMVQLLRDQCGPIDESPVEPAQREIRLKDSRRSIVANEHPPEFHGEADATMSYVPVEEPGAGRLSGGLGGHPRYQVRTLLGRGGMGLIYLADDMVESRPVVLKFLREDLLDRPRLVERFRREAAAATLLKHPNIVEAYGVEPIGRWPALVMEYVRGTDLARLIEKTGTVPIRVACELIRQAAIGLQYSFERGMVHRDIKPSNLIVSVGGTVKILDFGLAKMQSELSVDAGLTSTGAFLGSVDYMAPEQLDDPRLADVRADIYSLGCTLFHLLSGAPPFPGTTFEVLEAHRCERAAPLQERRTEVHSELDALVARMMAKEPGRRLPDPGRGGTPARAVREPVGGPSSRDDGRGDDRDGSAGRRRDPGDVIAARRHSGNRGHGTIDTRTGRQLAARLHGRRRRRIRIRGVRIGGAHPASGVDGADRWAVPRSSDRLDRTLSDRPEDRAGRDGAGLPGVRPGAAPVQSPSSS